MLKKIVLMTTICLALTVTTAEAQREGGAFFGPFASGNSSGGNFSATGCAPGYIVKHPRCNQPLQNKQKMKSARSRGRR
jgi:hypothetical protein